LYARQGSTATTDPAEAAALMGAVSSQWVLRDLNAVAQSLKRRPTVDSHRIGIVGFSMGGTFALTQACHNSDLKAAVMFYGKIPPPESFKYVLCPLLYHWAEQDGWIPARDVEQLRDGLAAAQRPCEIVRYPGCQHGFFNERHPEVYNKDAANRAWQKTLAFLAQHVR
ncbi:MAG: dienelactone hydrolase family protein, partial [Candidatus Omnitrophica bacterium]|nr:dienelactone hydrolase family protein [Candidatus Omnitrophota bacterium]